MAASDIRVLHLNSQRQAPHTWERLLPLWKDFNSEPMLSPVELAEKLSRNAFQVFIAIHEGDTCGFAIGSVNHSPLRPNPSYEVIAIWVSQDHRRKGVGRKLIQKICAFCEGARIPDVHLNARLSKEVHQFYSELGFQTYASRMRRTL